MPPGAAIGGIGQIMTQVDDEIIHKIYACATGEGEWEDALRPIMGLLGAKCLGIVKHSIAPVRAEVLVGVDVDPLTQAAYVEKYVRENPVINCLSAMPLGFISIGSGVVDETFYRSSAFYNEWQKPAGYADNMGISIARRRGEFVLLSMPRDFSGGLYTQEELLVIKPYVQHLVRAFNIWLRLTSAEQENEWVDEALDQVARGIIILGEERAVLYANKNAERLLAANEGLHRAHFRLEASSPSIAERLDAILALFESGAADDEEEYGFAIARGAGRPPLFVRVQPPLGHRPGQRTFGLPKALAFLHIVDPEERELRGVKLYCEAYGLTAGEARLVEAVIRTESIIEAAGMLEITEATARTHAKHVYAKTGVKSFSALVAQVHRSSVSF
jgi:DNA-binding CsgD family transcriptional regulator